MHEKKISKFVETHAHLGRDFTYSELDRTVESGMFERIWLHAIECFKDSPRHNSNRAVLEVAKHYPGVIEPFAFCRLDDTPDQVGRFKEEGFTGLKFICPVDDYDSPRFFPVYEQALKYDMPCFFHVGIIAKRSSKELVFPGQLASPRRMQPSMLDTISAEFPNLKIIAGHMGVPWCNQLYETLWYYPNIRSCVCGLSDYKWLLEHLDCCSSTGVPYYQKMMFASDSAYGLPGTLESVLERAAFFRMFFTEVGADRIWGRHGEDFMRNNAMNFVTGKKS